LSSKDPEDTRDLPAQYTETIGVDDRHDPDELPPGTRVGSYVIHDKIASGGGGTVYLAQAADPGAPVQRVAIKILLRELAASAQALARFQREAEVVTLINHPNIVAVLESGGLGDGRPYIVMELVAGENLRTMLRRRGRLPPGEMMQILEPTCSALAAAHEAGVIHRDLKASNISIGDADGRPVVKLLDFGIAKLTLDDPSLPGLTVKGSRLGTPYAMAPEQIRGDVVDERADIYSLGVLVYQVLTGSYPFSAASPQEIERLHLDAIPPRPSRFAPVSPALEAVVIRSLEKKPANRFRTVGEFLEALRRAVESEAAVPEAGEERPAVAIYVEAVGGDGEDEPADDAATVMDLAEQTMRQAGFLLPLLTGNMVLGARLLPVDPAARQEMVKDALVLARSVLQRIRERPDAHPDLSVNVSLHVGEALVRGPAESLQIVGGAILTPASWELTTDLDGVRVTLEGAAGLT
jgi:eukaryotic-like serine/threonine-protein kinase